MGAYCVFCGEEIPDDRLVCPECEVLVKDLTPDQRKALERLQADLDAAREFSRAWGDLRRHLVEALQPVKEIIAIFAEGLKEKK